MPDFHLARDESIDVRGPPSAFRADPQIKDDLLAALAETDPTPLTQRGVPQPELVAWAEQMGLPPAFVLLAAHVCQRFNAATPANLLARDLICSVAPGAALGAVPHLFAVWAWESAPEPLFGLMRSPDHRDAGAEMIALHRRVAAGEAVDRSVWRAARSRLNRLGEGDDDQAAAATVLAACAWDYDTTPGAALDMFNAWEKLMTERILAKDGWGEAETIRLQQLIRDLKLVAQARIGPAPDDADAEAVAAHSSRVVAELVALVNGSDDPLPNRKAALNATMGEACNALREQGDAALLALVGAIAPAAPS